jgi:hypothetical protein
MTITSFSRLNLQSRPDGTLTYKSAANAFGVATISVRLHDNGGGQDTSDAQTFKITVKPVADLPNVTPANTVVNTQTYFRAGHHS